MDGGDVLKKVMKDYTAVRVAAAVLLFFGVYSIARESGFYWKAISYVLRTAWSIFLSF